MGNEFVFNRSEWKIALSIVSFSLISLISTFQFGRAAFLASFTLLCVCIFYFYFISPRKITLTPQKITLKFIFETRIIPMSEISSVDLAKRKLLGNYYYISAKNYAFTIPWLGFDFYNNSEFFESKLAEYSKLHLAENVKNSKTSGTLRSWKKKV